MYVLSHFGCTLLTFALRFRKWLKISCDSRAVRLILLQNQFCGKEASYTFWNAIAQLGCPYYQKDDLDLSNGSRFFNGSDVYVEVAKCSCLCLGFPNNCFERQKCFAKYFPSFCAFEMSSNGVGLKSSDFKRQRFCLEVLLVDCG